MPADRQGGQGGHNSGDSHLTLFFGVSDGPEPTALDLSIKGVHGRGTIPALTQRKHHLVARPSYEPELVAIYHGTGASNRIDSYVLQPRLLEKDGVSWRVWVSSETVRNRQPRLISGA